MSMSGNRARLYVLILLAIISSVCWAEVDPFWLRSWEQAQINRPAVMQSNGRIAAPDEPGIPFVIHGQVFKPDGRTPASDVVVHSYHRDSQGFDFGPDENNYPVWRLQGWVKTDSKGYFRFQTIRPAPDHLGREGAHIHFTLETKEHGKQWAPTVYFFDDPLVKKDRIEESKRNGEFGAVRNVEIGEDVQYIEVKIKIKEKPDF